MATKLKNLRVKKVDFVDEGANPDADIKLFKRKDVEDTSKEDNKEKGTSVLKRLFSFIGKAAGMKQDEIDSAIEEIQKGDSVSFNEKINEAKNRKIADEIWDVCYALQSSLYSILNDEKLDSTSTANAMQESLDEFHTAVQDSITKWSSGKTANIVKKDEEVSETDLEIMKSAVERLNKSIKKAATTSGKIVEPENNENLKGDEKDMKIDKSKLTPAERAFLEDIEKRCGEEEGGNPPVEPPAPEPPTPAEPTVTKSATQPQIQEPTIQQISTPSEPDDIYKGLHPAVAAELEEFKKFRQIAEEKELADVAKKYAIIGKKEEELVPLFKSLRAAGGTAYNDMIAVLDQAVETVEKSGAFSEIGKSGGYGSTEGGAWAEANAKAAEIMKSRTGLSNAQALDEVFVANPELAARCEKED
ncbi:MAG: hypothetical protein K2N51_15510 [Lachnospiraceae bacterium]|nr:hypothetical protein [Lachnospiraceae bacterium]